jgi:tetratricopeptide (TPR) repeat protein
VADSLRGEALIAKLNSDLITNVELLRELYERKPYAVESSFSLAEGYYQLGNVEDAIKFYDKALGIDSNFALAHNHLGYCYTYLGEHEKALHHLRKYLSLSSTANSYDSYGDGLFAAGYFDSAAWAKEKGLSLDPKLYYLNQTLFYVRLYQGQLKKAEECVGNYKRSGPENTLRARAEYFEALLDYYRNEDADALAHCRAALSIFDSRDIATRDHELHWLLGLLYLRMGRQDLARRELREMEALIESNKINATNYRRYLYKSALHLRTCLAVKTGDVRALESFAIDLEEIRTKVKDANTPFDLSYFYTSLGELYLEKPFERAEFAEEYFIKSLKYNPHFPFAHHQLWLLYQRENKPEQAAEQRRELEKIWKDADPEWKAIYMPQHTRK